jgi:predicted acylesterase/phospholipase RssA
MLVIQSARITSPSRARIGLAVAGGGPIGGMYELGALRALDEAIEGFDPSRLDVYVGVSSGAFIAASLANRMSTAQLCRIFLTGDSRIRFRPETFLRPAFFEYIRRAASLPRILSEAWRDFMRDPVEFSISEGLAKLGGLIPTGIFDNSEIERFLRGVFTSEGRTNDFRELQRKLFVVAVDLDSGEAIKFGAEQWNDIPISRAVQASSALPGLYPPVQIKNRNFVDGALRRTMHASVALDEGVDLLIGLNPLVPFDASKALAAGTVGPDVLLRGGLPVVLSQTFRTLLQSRVQVGMAKYASQYLDSDQLVLEPNPDDTEMFFTNVFSYQHRHRVCEHAYQATLADLRERRETLGPILARHGLRLRSEILDEPKRSLMSGLGGIPARTEVTAKLRRALDDVDHLVLNARLPTRRGTAKRRASARRRARPSA